MGQAALVGMMSPFPDRSARNQTNTPIAIDRGASASSLLKRRVESVQRFETFSEISAADSTVIVAESQEVHFQRHSSIFKEGTPATQVALLLSGCLKAKQAGTNGSEVILRLNGPGDLLGTAGNRRDSRHWYTAYAVQASTILLWEMGNFESLVKRFPLLQRNIASSLERQLNEMDIRFREVSTEKVASRLSNLLVRLVKQVGKRVDGYFEVALSRRDLAQLTGTTLFTVSRLLCQWETQGIVSARREVVLVHNIAALMELSGEE